jgi:hypothetical protein
LLIRLVQILLQLFVGDAGQELALLVIYRGSFSFRMSTTRHGETPKGGARLVRFVAPSTNLYLPIGGSAALIANCAAKARW